MHDAEPPVTNNSKTHTDLPLLPGGNNGNSAAAADEGHEIKVWMLLEQAGEGLPDPPVELLDAGAVLDWVERASAGLAFRRDRHELLRDAMHILDDDWATARTTSRLRAQAERLQQRIEAKAAGTYWRERDSHRRATHPTHIVVNRESWNRAKTDAVARRSSIGVLVGQLVTTETRRRPQRDWSPNRPRAQRPQVRLFARIAVSTDTWAKFLSLARRSGITIERYLGVLVEEAFPSGGSRCEFPTTLD